MRHPRLRPAGRRPRQGKRSSAPPASPCQQKLRPHRPHADKSFVTLQLDFRTSYTRRLNSFNKHRRNPGSTGTKQSEKSSAWRALRFLARPGRAPRNGRARVMLEADPNLKSPPQDGADRRLGLWTGEARNRADRLSRIRQRFRRSRSHEAPPDMPSSTLLQGTTGTGKNSGSLSS